MRLSFISLTLGLLAIQTRLIHAGPCKPSPITSADESSTIIPTTTAVNSDDGMSETSALSGETTTSDISGATGITTIDESYADSATSSVSSTVTLIETSITAISTELSSTETLIQSPATTILPTESTSTALASSTTTSLEAPLGTTLNVIFVDEGYEKDVWLPVDDFGTSITSDVDKESSGALFGLEPATSRLYAVLPSGEKLYAASCTQCSRDSFKFLNEEQRAAGYFVFFVKCTEGDNRYLNCAPEAEGNPYPHMYFYELAGYYMHTRYSDRNGGTAIEFRLG
ncbi:hypothetical protein FVEN_g5714 [Fusarium venenatum]|nr:hypothetical protein FVEN_g5714 [Fusarium venenatum]